MNVNQGRTVLRGTCPQALGGGGGHWGGGRRKVPANAFTIYIYSTNGNKKC